MELLSSRSIDRSLKSLIVRQQTRNNNKSVSETPRKKNKEPALLTGISIRDFKMRYDAIRNQGPPKPHIISRLCHSGRIDKKKIFVVRYDVAQPNQPRVRQSNQSI
ncbi:unnamed protein product, partial [Ectocarpus sp. 13 AM-2016]